MIEIKNSKNHEIAKLTDENNRLKKSIEDLKIINELAKIISSTIPVEQILNKVTTVSVRAIGAEQGTISLLNEQEEEDEFKTLIRKVDASKVTNKYRLDDDLSGWMIKYRKPLMITNFNQDRTFKRQYENSEKIRSILSVPLVCKGKLIGVLNLFNKKQDGQFTLDDQRLLSIIASQSAQVIENARLYEEEEQLRLIEQELKTAHAIQVGLLPKESPRISGFDVAGRSYPATEVGGDYFDFIELDDHLWGIALGDVSGKGIPAALLMSNLQATLRNQALHNASLVECIEKANQFLCYNTESTKFVTLFCGKLNSEKRTFQFVNAGHNFPFYLNTKGEFETLEIGGVVLGMIPEFTFDQGEVHLQPGEIIVVYSDGVTEAENELEELLGEERLKNIILDNRHLSAQELVEIIYQKVKEFSGAAKQDDDITIVVLKAENAH
ncbi:MAG: GAF domain-containing SpoIIE family protein phosphatase [bacterium]